MRAQSALPKASLNKKFHDLTELSLRGCLVAKDAAMNLGEVLENSSPMGFLAIKECENELDQIERTIDEELPRAITRVGEVRARELLASLKFITDLERIGDLLQRPDQPVQGFVFHCLILRGSPLPLIRAASEPYFSTFSHRLTAAGLAKAACRGSPNLS